MNIKFLFDFIKHMHVRFKIENIKFSLYISVSNTCISRYPKIVKRTHLDILIY